MKPKSSIIAEFADRMATGTSDGVPEIKSFREFLTEHAWARKPDGTYVRYSLEGREALEPIINVIDLVLGSHTGVMLPDARLAICGGAQFGKTILELNLMAYTTAVLFINTGLYLPDEKLVEGIVDTKLRPDVIQKIDFLGPLMSFGKVKDNRDRALNRKGAFSVKLGDRTASGMIMGMNKIPTTFSMGLAAEDEKDDIPPKNSKYLEGRMAASDLRFRISIGTQRMHGQGQNKDWKEGSQGYFVFDVGNGNKIRLEELWPQVCRLALNGSPSPTDPKLTNRGDFEDNGKRRWYHKPGNIYYLADPETGGLVDRRKPIEHHLRPEQIALYNWSYSLAQLGVDAIDLTQIVSRWQKAVNDVDSMVVFRCEVLALPMNTTQALSPETLNRSRAAGPPFDLSLSLRPGTAGYGGLDTGNRCWFVAREVASEVEKRIIHAEDIALADVVRRAVSLFHKIGLSALFIDARPAVNEARQITYILNGLANIKWPKCDKPEESRIIFPGGLVWDGPKGRWENLRCAVVEFTRKPGTGIVQKIGREDADGETRFFPIIQCSRFDSIDRVIVEFQTPNEGIIRQHNGELYSEPVMLMPRRPDGSDKILETLDQHFITGSAREEDESGEKGEYVDKCENHLLLGNAYSALAEHLVKGVVIKAPVAVQSIPLKRRGKRYLG